MFVMNLYIFLHQLTYHLKQQSRYIEKDSFLRSYDSEAGNCVVCNPYFFDLSVLLNYRTYLNDTSPGRKVNIF